MAHKRRVDVSGRMTVFYGAGRLPAEALAMHPLQLGFTLGAEREPALVAIGAIAAEGVAADIVFLVDPAGCREIIGHVPTQAGAWHLTSEQRAIALALLGCDLPEPAGGTLRIVKAVELLCAVATDLGEDRLVPADGAAVLSELDTRRILAARRLIDEGWRGKLTLDGIARAAGLSRAKLTRGFKAVFECTVAEAIVERRLGGAHQLLLVTDLPVSSIGYRCGYSNNASFTRAFARRFGMAPTRLRAGAVAA